VTIRVTGFHPGSRQSSASVPPFAADAKGENQMKRFVAGTSTMSRTATSSGNRENQGLHSKIFYEGH
jgi:hypothetical protein